MAYQARVGLASASASPKRDLATIPVRSTDFPRLFLLPEVFLVNTSRVCRREIFSGDPAFGSRLGEQLLRLALSCLCDAGGRESLCKGIGWLADTQMSMFLSARTEQEDTKACVYFSLLQNLRAFPWSHPRPGLFGLLWSSSTTSSTTLCSDAR